MSSRLLIDEPPLLVIPRLAKAIGLNEAIVLQQVHYWLNPKFNKNFIHNRYWVRRTYKQWADEFDFWGAKTVRRTIDQLEEQKLLLTFKKTVHFKTVKYYTLDYERLDQVLFNLGNSSSQPPDPFCGEELGENDVPSCEVNPNMDILNPGSSPEEGFSSLVSGERNNLSLPVFVETYENGGSSRNGQNDHLDVPVWAIRMGQNDQQEEDKMTKAYKEDKNTFKKITPLLSSPSGKKETKEEEEHPISQNKSSVLAESMISIWNKGIQAKLKKEPLHFPKSELSKLSSLLKDYFQEDLAKWKSYCDQIAGCQFLMRRQESGFQVNFHWAIKPENITKVLNGTYYDKGSKEEDEAFKELPWEAYLASLKKRCESEHPSPQWFEISQNLAKILGQRTYNCFFSKAFPQHLAPDHLILAFSSRFQAEYVENKYRSQLERAFKGVFPNLESYRFIYDPTLKPQEKAHV